MFQNANGDTTSSEIRKLLLVSPVLDDTAWHRQGRREGVCNPIWFSSAGGVVPPDNIFHVIRLQPGKGIKRVRLLEEPYLTICVDDLLGVIEKIPHAPVTCQTTVQPYKIKRQYLLTCKVSRYRLLALHGYV